ncbi:hypothetical protein LCGC14_0221310 [marine sediment metagenome]|uniref:Aminoacyl-tRNA synthetase class I anticodon-binding domain-containing protein n=1 Tax=marine sediment metagenome TaxID=412755 RepID=A0A0F9XH73_9ZZZZ
MTTFCANNLGKIKQQPFQCSVCEQTFTVEANLDFGAEECPKCEKNLRTLVCRFIRLVITGNPDGMSLNDILCILGRDEVKRRIMSYKIYN